MFILLKKKSIIIYLFLLFFFSSLNSFSIAESQIPIYSTREAKDHAGKNAVVQGKVCQVSISRKKNVFINMDGKYPDQLFTAVVFKKYVKKFSDLNSYNGKIIKVTGMIQLYKDKPEIILRSPDQIKITTIIK